MNWIRDFTAQQPNQPIRDVEDAPGPMRQEFIDLVFGLSEHNPHAIAERQIYRIIGQSLGIGISGEPYGGFRYAAGRDIGRVEWNRIYDLTSRLWIEFERAGLAGQYRDGVNRILSAYGSAWDLSIGGRLERVLPSAAQAMVSAALAELSHPAAAPALQLFNAAKDAYDDRPRRDRDACSNIFDSMESVAKIKYRRPNDTFGQVKNYVETNHLLRTEILTILTGLNQIRNANFGHGMTVQFSLSPAETDFVYLTCIGTILLLTRTT